MCRDGRRRLIRIVCAALVGILVTAASASAYSIVISNGRYAGQSGHAGVFAPRHSLNKVDVQRTSSYGEACENALNNNGTWAQQNSYCTYYGTAYVYHLFCACQLRYGWNGLAASETAVWMLGIEYY